MNAKAFQRFFPDVLSLFRLIASPFFLFLPFGGIPFFVLYILCGCSDVADGFLARRWHVTTRFGSTLDSLADLAFFVFVGIAVYPYLPWQNWYGIWIAAIIFIRLLSLVIGWLRFRAFGWIHTFANKAAGFALFLLPIGLYISQGGILLPILFFLTSVSSLEELLIIISEKTHHPNIRSCIALLKKGTQANEINLWRKGNGLPAVKESGDEIVSRPLWALRL